MAHRYSYTGPPRYWLVPVGLLGAAHLVTAALIKEPEVTPGLHGALGLCLLGHVRGGPASEKGSSPAAARRAGPAP